MSCKSKLRSFSHVGVLRSHFKYGDDSRALKLKGSPLHKIIEMKSAYVDMISEITRNTDT